MPTNEHFALSCMASQFKRFVLEYLVDEPPRFGGIAVTEVIEAFAIHAKVCVPLGSKAHAVLAHILMHNVGYAEHVPTLTGSGAVSVLNRDWKPATPVMGIVNAIRVSIPAYGPYMNE